MDVVVWLRSLGLGKYEAIFRENERHVHGDARKPEETKQSSKTTRPAEPFHQPLPRRQPVGDWRPFSCTYSIYTR
jgi:hypothetical protein